jgi:hypothetical protein
MSWLTRSKNFSKSMSTTQRLPLATSFRFRLAADTFAVRLAVPLIGPAEVFHLLGLRPAGRTKKKPSLRLAGLFTKRVGSNSNGRLSPGTRRAGSRRAPTGSLD